MPGSGIFPSIGFGSWLPLDERSVPMVIGNWWKKLGFRKGKSCGRAEGNKKERRSPRIWRRPWLEPLEDRTLLNAPPVDFAHLHQVLLPPGETQTVITAPAAGQVNIFYEFEANGAPPGQTGHFLAFPSNQSDQATLGLYDGSGNFLGPFQFPEADISLNLTPGKVYILGVILNVSQAGDQFTVTSTLSGEAQQPAINLDP